MALPWIPTSNYDRNKNDPAHDLFAYPKFATIQEAEDAIQKTINDSTRNSWLPQHLGVPFTVAPLIHEFVSYKPCPAFFLEEGDLCLDVQWDNGFATWCRTIYIGRKIALG